MKKYIKPSIEVIKIETNLLTGSAQKGWNEGNNSQNPNPIYEGPGPDDPGDIDID